MNKAVQKIEIFVFWSRWFQAPLYIGLTLIQLLFAWHFMRELWHLFSAITEITEITLILTALGLIDLIMVANLIIMVVIGGYETFVSRLDLEEHPDQPEWLEHVNASVLKVKLATALIAISSIHLLKSFFNPSEFVNANGITQMPIFWQVIIHLTLLASAFMVAYTDKVMNIAFQLTRQNH